MEDMCLIVTPEIRQLTEKILKKYPSASQRVNLTADRVRTWVESYNKSYNKNPDFVPEVEEVVADAEKKLNMDGKSFLYIPEHVVYTPTGKGQQTYTIIGKKIFNKNGEDVFPTDSKDRNKIFANLAVQNKRAVVVEYQGKKYVVNNRNQIISATGDEMKWGEENGDRKAILALSKAAFEAKQKVETATTTSNGAVEGVNILGPETKININAGTGENADLSNFAERPFNFREGYEDENSEAYKYFLEYHPILPDTFNSVEQAFQAFKFAQALISTDYIGEYLGYDTEERANSESYKYGEKISNQLDKIINAKTSAEAKRLGEQSGILNNNDVALWDEHSSEIMKILLKQSFKQNPQALQRLLATGNATLTHTQDRSKWGTEFPKLLMEVREELRRDNPQFGNNSFQAEGQNISTTEDVYNFIKAQYPEDSSESKLTDLVFTALRSNPNIKFKKADLGEGISGKFVASENTILINNDPKYIQSNTIFHEAIHAVTSYYLKASNTEGFSKEVKIAIEEIKECYNLLKQDFIAKWEEEGVKITENNFDFWTNGNDTYGLKSPEEMIAELGKPSFVKHIKDFDKRHKGQNIFQRLINAVAKLFSINKSYGNLESTLKKAVATLLTNPNKELMNRYAKENATIKENVKKLKSSNHVITELRKQVIEMIERLSKDTSTDGDEYADTEFRFNKDQIEYFKLPENIKVPRFRDLHQGTIFVFENSLFFSLNGNITLNGDTVVLPVRVYSTEGLTLNNLNIKRDSYGLDCIESITPVFNTQVQTNTINQDNNSVEIIEQLINHLKSIGINVFDKAQMEKYLKENPNTPLWQAIEEQKEMQDIKAKAIANGTFMKAPNGKPTNLTERQWLQVRTKNFINWFGDWLNNPTSASKVVDENGEPKVVYHGSKTTITIFDSSKSDARYELSKIIKPTNFFSDDKTVADAFAKTEKQSIANAIAASLNVVAEAQVEDENEGWNHVANSVNKSVDWVKNFWLNELSLEERMDASDGIMYDPNVENQKYQVFLNLRNPIIIDAKGERADKVLEENKDVINNNDEVIILNIDETVGKQETSVDYLVRKSNNIKSATDNNGMFSTENDDIQMFMTPEGKVYGFVTLEGDIYLDETVISPEHPIHEYTHLWDRFVAKRNPRLWETGINIMKKTSEWQKILNDDNYGKKWQKMYDDAATLDNLIASEVHARLTGRRGSQLLEQISKEKGGNDIISKLKQWLFDFWKSIKGAFTPWSDAELQKLNNLAEKDIDKALQYLSDMTLRDFTEGVNPSTASLSNGVIEAALSPTTKGNTFEPVASNNDAERFNSKKESKNVISSNKTILSNEELKYWNEQGVDSMPRILSASERTDPAFHVKEILDIINGKKTVPQWGVVNGKRQIIGNLTGKDFAGLYLITKHDGLPMLDLLETKIPKLIHFSITTLGGTQFEPGVMKYNDLLDKIQDYIKQGLDPNSITIRIDPIVPGATKKEDIETVVRRASEMGIKRIRFSIMDAYQNTRQAMKSFYDFNKYYDDFHAKKQYQDEIFNLMVSLKDKYGVTVGTCAEPLARNGIQKEGCLSVAAINQMLGTSIEDKGTDNNKQRKLCSCYGGKIDALAYNSKCASHCIYCYAKHENEKALEYYNEDGTLKDNVYTRATRQQTSQVNPVLDQFKQDIKTLAGYYKGGGRVLKDDLPSITQELDDKLNDYFMGGEELSVEDYRNLWKLIEFYDDNGERHFRERKIPSSSNIANTINNGTSSNATYGMSDAMEAFYHKAVAEKFGTNNSTQTNTQNIVPEANKPKPERPKSVTYESALKPNYSRMAQFSRTFSPQQIKDRGAMIADIFSENIDLALGDEIDACLDIIESSSASEDEKTQAKQRYNLLRDPLYGRQTIVQEKGVDAIMQEIIQDIETSMDYAEGDKKLLYQNTLDYFTELFNTQATLDIEEREGIRIVSLEVVEKTASEEAADEQDDGNDEIGHIVSGSDGWSFQIRYENPFNSLSKKVRSMLYDIKRPNTEKDDLGNTRKYSMGQIYASLLTYLAKNMHSADDFIQIDKSYEGTDYHGSNITKDMYPNGYPTFPVLEQMKNMYPWVNQLIDRLTDDYMSPDWNTDLRYPSTGGAMASQFYTNFRKAFIPYAKIQLGDNKFGVTPLNYEMEDRVQYDKLKANYNNRLILTDHSIYNADGKLNKKNAKWLHYQISFLLHRLDYYSDFYKLLEEQAKHPKYELLDEKTIKEHDIFIDKCREVLNSFGIDATTDSVVAYAMIDDKLYEMLQKLEWVTENLLKVEDKDIDSFDYILDTRDKYKTNLWAHFFDGLGMITDGSYMQSFYDSASHKTKYSYSADNYLMKMFRGACMGTLEERRQFIDEHFGKYEWFKNQDTGEWRNKWLEYWYNEPDEQRELPYKNIDNITEYKEDETIIRPYVKWTEDDIWQVQNRNYAPGSKSKFGFFLAPIFSDSPMSMTVKGPKLDMTQLLYGYNDNTGHHQGALVSLVNQELWRIGFTQRRAEEIKKGNIKAISNFDGERGQQFCFLPELNKYTFKDTGETFLERMVSLRNRRATLDEIESSQIEAIEDIIDKKAIEYMEENDKHYESEPIKKDAYYNMVYANAAIIQMTTVDLAFYKSDVDFQKRFKEVYAGGIELNTNSKYGKKTENVILLTDDTITSPSYDKIAAIIDNSESLSQSDKDYIKSTFTEINVADAQAIRSMHSYRSVLDMMGRWDDRMEEALQNFKNKEWKREDFDIIFQTIKPFVYAVIDRNDGFGGKIPVPQQNKNSEICALMMYDLIVNDLKDSPVYRALSRFMEETADANGEPLIDMAQFESAGKVGNQGVINISFNPNKVINIINQGIVIDGKEFTFYPASKDGKFLNNTVENAEKNYKEIKKDIDKDLIEGRMSQKEHNEIIAYLRPTEDEIIDMLSQAALITNSDGSKSINSEVVHTIPFSNYYQQQPTPAHHIDTEATYGSQARNIAVADLPEDFELTLEGKGKNKKTFKGRDAIIDFYYELLNENLIEDFFGKGKKQGLKGIFATKESLRDAITDIVRGNPKYGRDFAEALQIDNNKNFVLNPNSPTMFTLTQELITSFFKNRITKQTINGAALIQAAGIGLDDKLRIVFDENGKVLGAQCLMPLTAKAFFEPLLEEETINGKKVKVLKPEKLEELGLNKAIGYRIPTENKSSMMPLIITGFTPLQNGSCIVLPAEITNIAGSDFDVDKMFIMLLSFNIITHDKKKALEDYAKQEHEDAQKMINLLGKANIEDLEIDEIGGNFAEWFKKHEDEYLLKTPIIKKVEYDFGKDFSKSPKDNSRKARNNMLIQLTYKILTSKEGSESLFNPQGFADVKRAAKITRILTDTNLRKALLKNNEALGILPPVNTIVSEFLSLVQKKYPEQYDDIKQAVSKMTAKQIQQAYLQAITAGQHGDAIQMLLNSSTKDLEKFIEKNSAPESPVFPQTFTHSHAKNMAGSNQIGIYAIQASMAAKYQRASVKLLEKQQFTVNGRKITNVDVSDNGKRLKNLGQMIGASADNGKDPNLSDMGSTDKTAPIIGYMLRSGLTHLEAALIINQNHMRNANYSSKKYKYWDSILGKNHLSVPVENVTTDMLIKGLISPFELTAEEDKQIAALCYRILTQHEAQEYLTQISRADSPNGSIQNTYAKARIQQYKVDLFQAKMGQKDFPFLRIKEAISNKAIDTAASEGVVREQLKAQKMGFLHGMYALGINSFSNLVSPYFFGARKKFDDVVVKPILYNLDERLSDTKKEKIINNIYTSYITFILSGTPLFGTNSTDSMKQKRDYYLESFPDDYIKIIQENEDIRKLLSSILQVNSFGSRKRIILQDVGSLSKEQKQSIQFRFESLADSENPVARQLATDLFVYSYFDNGLQFTHDSFSHLFSTRFLTNFPVYNEALQKLDEDLDESEYKNFIQQFLVTFNNAAFKVDDIITKDNLDESTDTIKINLNDKQMYYKMVNELMSPKPQFEINVYPYISYNNEIYVLDEDLFSQYPGNPTYHKLPKYATYPRLPLFIREMNITELAEEFPISESTKPSNTNNSSSDAPMAYNESDEDSSIDNSTDAAFEAMDDFVPDYDPNDIENIPISKSDTYLNEGNDELQKPMCEYIAKKF